MISDSNFSTYHMHFLEKVLDEKEIKLWDSDIKNTLPEVCLNICNIDKYKDTDDAFEVNIIDSIQLYQKEAVETQLSSIEKLVNLNENENEIVFSNNTINLNNVVSFLDQSSSFIGNNSNGGNLSISNTSSNGHLNTGTPTPILRSANL